MAAGWSGDSSPELFNVRLAVADGWSCGNLQRWRREGYGELRRDEAIFVLLSSLPRVAMSVRNRSTILVATRWRSGGFGEIR